MRAVIAGYHMAFRSMGSTGGRRTAKEKGVYVLDGCNRTALRKEKMLRGPGKKVLWLLSGKRGR